MTRRQRELLAKLARRPKPRSKEDGNGLREAQEALTQAQEAAQASKQLARDAEAEAVKWQQIRRDNGFTRALRELFGS